MEALANLMALTFEADFTLDCLRAKQAGGGNERKILKTRVFVFKYPCLCMYVCLEELYVCMIYDILRERRETEAADVGSIPQGDCSKDSR